MSTTMLHPAADAYLRQVRREGRDLPRDRLAELLSDLEEHLAAAIPADASTGSALEVLDRLGDPREIVAAERPDSVVQRRGTQEWAAIFLLLFGAIAVGIGWLVGVVLLWRSRAWTSRDKLIGTFFLPGGVWASAVLVLFAAGNLHADKCTSRGAGLVRCTHAVSSAPPTIVSIALILLALTPIASAVLLVRRAG